MDTVNNIIFGIIAFIFIKLVLSKFIRAFMDWYYDDTWDIKW